MVWWSFIENFDWRKRKTNGPKTCKIGFAREIKAAGHDRLGDAPQSETYFDCGTCDRDLVKTAGEAYPKWQGCFF